MSEIDEALLKTWREGFYKAKEERNRLMGACLILSLAIIAVSAMLVSMSREVVKVRRQLNAELAAHTEDVLRLQHHVESTTQSLEALSASRVRLDEKACVAMLFETNLKEVKNKICH
jgi:hypothetical protein